MQYTKSQIQACRSGKQENIFFGTVSPLQDLFFVGGGGGGGGRFSATVQDSHRVLLRRSQGSFTVEHHYKNSLQLLLTLITIL